MCWKIKRAMRRLNYQRPIFWTFLHQTAALIGKLPGEYWIYHCVDDWPELLPMASMGRPTQIMQDEWDLIQRVDIVFSVSTNLLRHYDISPGKLHFIPNGVDVALFDPNDYMDYPRPNDIARLPRPIIGFSGSLGKWIDTDLIIYIAKAFPKTSVVLIGLNEKNPHVTELQRQKNIHFLGMKSREQVPVYISAFDVCLMPFARTAVGSGLLPLKLFEYLAMGKPIIATSSHALKSYEDILYLAKNTDEFRYLVDQALAESGTNLAQNRRARAEEYSWAARIRIYDEALQTIVQNNGL
ncbi:MAG: glycosyltransferase [Candidatus Marinimicrobia bacterium]|nr:glycosyltransferase [Candidatus Neomarinimicrobiota bacterium]